MKKIVFISHITEESELAQILSNYIKKSYLGMLDVFVSSDDESIPSGDRWLENISTALESSAIQLVLCSDESINRPWINFEAGAAWIRKIPVIPICHSGFSKNNLPIPLAIYQGCNLQEMDDVKSAFSSFTNALGSLSPEVDFNEFINECKEFSRNYTYFAKIKASLNGLRRLFPENIADLLTNMPHHITLKIPDFQKPETFQYLDILKSFELISINYKGTTAGSHLYTNLDIDILPNFLKLIEDELVRIS